MTEEKKIQSMPYCAGNKKESSWPPPLKLKGYRGKFYLDKDTGELLPGDPPKKRNAGYFIQNDEIPATESMATAERKMFTSRKKLEAYDLSHGYRHTGGAHMQEKEAPPDPKKQFEELREATTKAYYDIKYDNVPFTEKEKELCRQEENQFNQYKKRQ